MQSILVPTDFSKCSYNATRYAIAIAKETKAKIILLNVYQTSVAVPRSEQGPMSVLDLEEDSIRQLKKMAEFESHLHGPEGLEIQYEAVMGATVDQILNRSRVYNVGMLIMGTQGATGLKKMLFGSNTSSIIGKSTIPVLAVPESAKYLGFNKLVFAADFHQINSNKSLASLQEIALLFNAEILFFSVRKNENEVLSVKQAFERLNLGELFHAIPHSFHTVISDDIEGAIDHFVKENFADLLITMPKKHTLMEFLLNKSISRDLVFHSATPILCIPEILQTIES